MGNNFTDDRYPAIPRDGVYTYERGDGAKIRLEIKASVEGELETLAASYRQPAANGSGGGGGPIELVREKPRRSLLELFDAPPPAVEEPTAETATPPTGPRWVDVTQTPARQPPPPLRLSGHVEGRGNTRKAAAAPLNPPQQVAGHQIFDNPIIGGKFTVFMLLYGDYFDMHRRALTTLLATLPPGRAEVRIGSNELGSRSLELVEELKRTGQIAHHYRYAHNRRKYPVMRDMFWDPDNPITTKYLLWFDDDTICDRAKDWMTQLATQIVSYHDTGYRLYGPHYIYKLSPSQIQWVKEASWYKHRMFCDAKGNEVPNGDKVHFATGSFWAMEVAAMREAQIPDTRLGHNGGDWACGEAIHQAGYKIKRFSQKKQIVNWSSVPRRGLSESHPGKNG